MFFDKLNKARGVKMKNLPFLFLLSILLLFLPLRGETELNLSLTTLNPLYADINSTPVGGYIRLFLKRNLDYLDIRGSYTRGSSDIKSQSKMEFSIQVERVLWRKLVVNWNYSQWREAENLFVYYVFNKTRSEILSKKWKEAIVGLGLGVRLGEYRKSFFSAVGNFGYTWVNKITDLKLLDKRFKNNLIGTPVLGMNLKTRLELKTFWFDFEGDYNYLLKDKESKAEFIFGVGARIVKRIGIKGNVLESYIGNRKGLRYTGVAVGVVVFLGEV